MCRVCIPQLNNHRLKTFETDCTCTDYRLFIIVLCHLRIIYTMYYIYVIWSTQGDGRVIWKCCHIHGLCKRRASLDIGKAGT